MQKLNFLFSVILIASLHAAPNDGFAAAVSPEKTKLNLQQQCDISANVEDTAMLVDFFNQYGTESAEAKATVLSQILLGRPSVWASVNNNEKRVEEKLRVSFSPCDSYEYYEAVVAAAYAKNLDEFIEHLRKIRYLNAEVSMISRLHFPEADSAPVNIKQNYLHDITQEVARFDVTSLQRATATVNKKSWFETFKKPYADEYTKEYSKYAEVAVSMSYIDFEPMFSKPVRSIDEKTVFFDNERSLYDKMVAEQNPVEKQKLQTQLAALRKDFFVGELRQAFVDAMPPISFVNFVVPTYVLKNAAGHVVTQMLVKTTGIIVKRNGQLFVRHGSAKAGSLLKEVPFADFFSDYLYSGSDTDSVDNRRSTWRGLNILSLAKPN